MAHAVEGGDLIKLVEIDQDFCTRTYGSAPCTAALGSTGSEKCRNTFATCQDTANYDRGSLTLKFTQPSAAEPRDGIYFPSLVDIQTTAPRLNTTSRRRSSALGERGVLRATFIDHPSTDRVVDKYAEERLTGAAQADGVGYDPLDRGTFWGKWRARTPFYQDRPIRATQGVAIGGDFTDLLVRNYLIERIEGPDSSGRVTVVAKDILKKIDDDRAQAPAASNGVLSADITAGATAATLSPTGIGDDEYPASGTASIGKEVVTFTRTGDSLTLVRGQSGTEAKEHDADDTFQLAIDYTDTVDDIILDLLTNYAGIDASFIPHTNNNTTDEWGAEVASYIPNNYGTVIAKPTAVKKLIGDLAEQAGFNIWWDDVAQKVKLAAIKQPGSSAETITDDWVVAGSLRVKDRPDSRISQLWTNFGPLSPTESLTSSANYRSTLASIDASAGSDNEYGQDAVRVINAYWIQADAKDAAIALNQRLIGRYRDIIRDVTFTLPSYRSDDIRMGTSHFIQSRIIQDANGGKELLPIRILSVEHDGDVIHVNAEELRFAPQPGGPGDPEASVHNLVLDTSQNNYNMRDHYDTRYPGGPQPDTDIVCTVEGDVVLGSTSNASPAFDVGDWSDLTYNSITINFETGNTTSGKGGDGQEYAPFPSIPASAHGGPAFYTRTAVTVNNSGTVQGGGGGGGLHSTHSGEASRSPGGGGAGAVVGQGFPAAYLRYASSNGTLTAGGAGATDSFSHNGGAGGNPGTAGASGSGSPGSNYAGGNAGVAVDGKTYVNSGAGITDGTVHGAQVN